MKKLFRSAVIAAVLVFSPAMAKDVVHGKSSLGVVPNVSPCPTDCAPGKVCHMTLSVTGAPAKELLKTLKEYGVKPDEGLKDIGLTIYFSKDGLLSCETDGINPSCAISFNPPQLKIEPLVVCE
jgi:hypothetical protein